MPSVGGRTLDSLMHMFQKPDGEIRTVAELRTLFKKTYRALIFDSDVTEQVTVKVSTAHGAYLCADLFISALERCNLDRAKKMGYVPKVPGSLPTPFARNAARRIKRMRNQEAAVTLSAGEFEARTERFQTLNETRVELRDIARMRVAPSSDITD